jgi:hypothetical protein
MEVRESTPKQKAILVVEVKDKKSKAGTVDAEKFIAGLSALKADRKADHILAVYINTGGFSTAALSLLEKAGVKAGTAEELGV